MAQYREGFAYKYDWQTPTSLRLPPQWKGIDFGLEPAVRQQAKQPPNPLADVDWAAYIPGEPLPHRPGDQDMRVGDVWAGRMPRELNTPGYVLKVLSTPDKRSYVDVRWLAGHTGNAGPSTNSLFAQHARLIARDGKLVATPWGSAITDDEYENAVKKDLKVKPAEAAKVEVKCSGDKCKNPVGVPLGYYGKCWPCSDDEERRYGCPQGRLPQPEPLRMTGYDNSVAGIGVVPGIWRLR